MKKNNYPFEINKNYFIRTITMALVGKLIEVYDDFLILSNASWVADSGRFNDALRLGLLMNDNVDIEPFVDNVIVNKNSIVDMTIYNHDLPKYPN